MAERGPRDFVAIRRYADAFVAELDRAVLEANDIEARVIRDDAGGMIPSLQLTVAVRLLVRMEDSVRALALLEGSDEAAGETDRAAG